MYSPRFIRCVLNVLSITNRVIIPCKGRAAVWSMLFNHLRAMQPLYSFDNHTHLRIIFLAIPLNRRNPALTECTTIFE